MKGYVLFIGSQLRRDLEAFLEGDVYGFRLIGIGGDRNWGIDDFGDIMGLCEMKEMKEMKAEGEGLREARHLKITNIPNIILIDYFQWQMVKKEERKGLTETAIDTTINVHKLSHRVQFKKKAPRAISEIRKLVAKMMKTPDVRVDPKLNQFIWSQGIRNLPRRVRVRISRKRNEDEGKNGSEWYSLVQHVNVEDFAGKQTEKVKVSA